MNTLKGRITKIETSGSLSLIEIMVGAIPIKTILIETPNTSSYLQKGNNVTVIFKETEVVIGNEGAHHISMQNKLKGTVVQIKVGQLLSKVTVETAIGKINSIITSNAVKQLHLNIGAKVVVMIKTNEIMIGE